MPSFVLEWRKSGGASAAMLKTEPLSVLEMRLCVSGSRNGNAQKTRRRLDRRLEIDALLNFFQSDSNTEEAVNEGEVCKAESGSLRDHQEENRLFSPRIENVARKE
jgi:hypothetical protein